MFPNVAVEAQHPKRVRTEALRPMSGILTSLAPHSAGQNKSQSQPRLNGQGRDPSQGEEHPAYTGKGCAHREGRSC